MTAGVHTLDVKSVLQSLPPEEARIELISVLHAAQHSVADLDVYL